MVMGWGEHSTPGVGGLLWRTAWSASPGFAAVALADSIVRGLTGPLRLVALGALVGALAGGGPLLVPVASLIALVAVQSVVPHLTDPVVRELGRRVDLRLRLRAVAATITPIGIAEL